MQNIQYDQPTDKRLAATVFPGLKLTLPVY